MQKMIELHICKIEISKFVEQSMSVMKMVHIDVSQFNERMYELPQLEHDHKQIHHHTETIIFDE
jgi:hypothetical protein